MFREVRQNCSNAYKRVHLAFPSVRQDYIIEMRQPRETVSVAEMIPADKLERFMRAQMSVFSDYVIAFSIREDVKPKLKLVPIPTVAPTATPTSEAESTVAATPLPTATNIPGIEPTPEPTVANISSIEPTAEPTVEPTMLEIGMDGSAYTAFPALPFILALGGLMLPSFARRFSVSLV